MDPSKDAQPPKSASLQAGRTSHDAEIEKPIGNVVETNTASVAFSAALAEQKPDMWSRPMLRLYGIMAVGYLVSTINGFGTSLRLHIALSQRLTCEQMDPSWVLSMP